MANFIYTNRVLEKMAVNGLERWQVEKTYNEPDNKEKSVVEGSISYRRVREGVEIGVIASEKEGKIYFISAWKRELFRK